MKHFDHVQIRHPQRTPASHGDPFLPIHDAARQLGECPLALEQAARRGILAVWRVDGHTVVRLSAAEEFLARDRFRPG